MKEVKSKDLKVGSFYYDISGSTKMEFVKVDEETGGFYFKAVGNNHPYTEWEGLIGFSSSWNLWYEDEE